MANTLSKIIVQGAELDYECPCAWEWGNAIESESDDECPCDDKDAYFEGSQEMCGRCGFPHPREYERQERILGADAVVYCGGGRWKGEVWK